MYWSKRDKRLFLLLVTATTIILVLLTNELYFKMRVEKYIKEQYGEAIRETKRNSELTLELLNYNSNDSIRKRRN